MRDFHKQEKLESRLSGFDKFKNGLDKALFMGAINGEILYELINYMKEPDVNPIMKGLIAVPTLTLAVPAINYLAFSNKRLTTIKKTLSKIKNFVYKAKPIAWTGRIAMTGIAAVGILTLAPDKAEINNYIAQNLNSTNQITLKEEREIIPLKVSKERPALYDILGYKPLIEHDMSGTILANELSDKGRIQRTKRWKNIYQAIEQAYDLPKNLLGAMIIEESTGDPSKPNMSKDGGFGPTHQQGTTADEFGLDIFGGATFISDIAHGIEIEKMLSECNYDLAKIQAKDERGHFIKNLDTTARILTLAKERYGSWSKAIQRYGPGAVGSKRAKTYEKRIKKWMNALEDSKLHREASIDFLKRNSKGLYQPGKDNLEQFEKEHPELTLKHYHNQFYEMANNWGLETYIKVMNNLYSNEKNQVSTRTITNNTHMQFKTHKVNPGETYSKISRKFSIPIIDLKKLNGRNSNELKAGEEIRVGAQYKKQKIIF